MAYLPPAYTVAPERSRLHPKLRLLVKLLAFEIPFLIAYVAIPPVTYHLPAITVKTPSPVAITANAIGIPKVSFCCSPDYIKSRASFYAALYNVSLATMWRVIKCEDGGLDPAAQSWVRYTKDHPAWGVKAGDRELSFGLAQIHLPAHPNITIQQATDPDFALRFMASKIAQGRGSMWSCYQSAK